MVGDGAFSHKIDRVYIFWVDFAIGGVSAVEGLQSTGLPRIVNI